jgi:hypothetical protein
MLSLFSINSAAQSSRTFQDRWNAGTPISVTGVLTIMYADDFAHQRAELIHNLSEERTGKTFRLQFDTGAPAQLRSGMRITARGRVLESEIYLAAADATSVTVTGSAPNSATAITGNQKTLVMVANFRDKVLDPLVAGADCSTNAIGDRMFTDPSGQSVDALYRETSFEGVSFSGTVIGTFTIDAASTDACDTSAWARALDAQALASGVDSTAFNRKVYVLPTNTCPYAGIAEVALTPSRAWIFSCDRTRVYGHELGHNLGFQHASTDASEYGDDSDLMGMMGGLKPFNAPHKWQAGWLTESKTTSVTAPGTYNVAPLPLSGSVVSLPQMLRASRPGTPDSFYVSYRHGTGFEANTCCDYLERTSVHRWAGGVAKTYLVAALADGETFTDPVSGFSVTQLSHGEAFATVNVKPAAGCGAAAPTVTLSPRDQGAAAGSQVAYDAAILNNDAASCPVSSFAIARNVPAGWAASLSTTTLQLAPAAVGHATLLVSSASSSAAGTYQVTASVSDAINGVHSATATGTYAVSVTGDTIAPSAPSVLAARLKAKQVDLTWHTSSDNVAVAGYRVSRNGVVVATTTSAAWSEGNLTSGSYAYFVTAYDAAGNVSTASNTVTVSIASVKRR